MELIPMTRLLIREIRERQRAEESMTSEVELGVMQLQPKKAQNLQRMKDHDHDLMLDFWPPEL